MPVFLLRVDTGNRDQGLSTDPGNTSSDFNSQNADPYPTVQRLFNTLKAGLAGATVTRVDAYAEGVGVPGTTVPVCARGSISLGTTITGAVGATIAGTLVTVTAYTAASGSQPEGIINASNYQNATALLLVRAINNTVALAGVVVARLDPYNVGNGTAGTVSNILLTAFSPGTGGNAVTLVLSGTGVTVSGATLTGGVLPTAILPQLEPMTYFPASG
jgi:hypothetical protein